MENAERTAVGRAVQSQAADFRQRRDDLAEADFRLGEGQRMPGENGVDRPDQRPGGAIVGAQRVNFPVFCRSLPRRLEIGRQISAAKTVDRLPGIADHEKGRIVTFGENRAEYLILHRIGVLKLIDDAGFKAAAQRRGQPSVRRGQSVAHPEQEIVEPLKVVARLPFREFFPHEIDRVAPQPVAAARQKVVAAAPGQREERFPGQKSSHRFLMAGRPFPGLAQKIARQQRRQPRGQPGAVRLRFSEQRIQRRGIFIELFFRIAALEPAVERGQKVAPPG
ncbi:hypothetical protein SDC9_126213 [bioreactor metagenome]|uniref:Uncharacterized protein n=1 Tax=bioreactor metagenome TaxID=1076179 RepID=A0A645CQ02_9ZZZZ